MRISVITPSTGSPLLKQAVESVLRQEYDDIEYYIFIDGKEREEATFKVLDEIQLPKTNLHTITLPFPTGIDRFNGHRIFGSSAYLARGDLIAFLDEDNWYDSNHFSTLVKTMIDYRLDWTYSLRKIMSPDGEFLTNDDCESLGIWKACIGDFRHVDTSCYLLKRADAISISPIWYKQFRDDSTHTPDAIICNKLVDFQTTFGTNGLHSVNYRLGGSSVSVRLEFFEKGREIMRQRYPHGFPWYKGPATSRDYIS
jgi:glycosyltransferase involved in cell wall biosynthesis